jgi:hypothetical protein
MFMLSYYDCKDAGPYNFPKSDWSER